jgi:hypothetical protein
MRLEPHTGIYAPDEWLCEVAGVHRTTVARWRARKALPLAVMLLLRVMYYGELELVNESWKGFRLDPRSGVLWTPENWPCTPGDLLAIKYRAAQVQELERRLSAALGLSDLDRLLAASAA